MQLGVTTPPFDVKTWKYFQECLWVDYAIMFQCACSLNVGILFGEMRERKRRASKGKKWPKNVCNAMSHDDDDDAADAMGKYVGIVM